MGRKASRRRRNPVGLKQAGNIALAMKPPTLHFSPRPLPQPPQTAAALPLSHRQESLVTAEPALDRLLQEPIVPIPRNRALVDPRQPFMRRLRFWLVGAAERWATRHRPLPEQPTLAQLDRLRKEMASVQRKLDKMLG